MAVAIERSRTKCDGITTKYQYCTRPGGNWETNLDGLLLECPFNTGKRTAVMAQAANEHPRSRGIHRANIEATLVHPQQNTPRIEHIHRKLNTCTRSFVHHTPSSPSPSPTSLLLSTKPNNGSAPKRNKQTPEGGT